MRSVNPYNNQLINDYVELSDKELRLKLIQSDEAFKKWKDVSFSERSNLMKKLAALLLDEEIKFELATLISNEIGKPIKESLAEIVKCAWVCNYYAVEAESILHDKIIETEASKSFVSYKPLGVILAIMPWNYPFWQYFRFIAPNLMAGNVGVLKHASNVSGCALAIEELFRVAGFPIHISQTLLISGHNASKIIKDSVIKAVSFTGSLEAGSKVASLSGKYIKKTVLELGGNNALVVFSDVNIDDCVDTIINARFQNSGQSCIAGKRLIVHESIVNELLDKLKVSLSKLKLLDPLNMDAKIGVLAKEKFALDLENQMLASIEKGAILFMGGKRDKAYFEPTILTNVKENMPIFKEETFGPLLAVTVFKDDEEAIYLSNKSDFGLGVSIFTKNENRILKMINKLDEGAVFVNELVKSDPRLPFGGIKKSGFGRELSREALFEFVNIKTVYIK